MGLERPARNSSWAKPAAVAVEGHRCPVVPLSIKRVTQENRAFGLTSFLRIGKHLCERIRAVAVNPESGSEGAGIYELKQRAKAQYERFKLSGNLAALDDAIDTLRSVLTRDGLDDDNRGAVLTSLGVMRTDRSQVVRSSTEFEEGLMAYREAVELARPDSASLPGRLSNLATGLWEYFEITRGSEVLREAFEAIEEAIALTPSGSPQLPGRVLNYSAILYAWLEPDPIPAAIDQAIDVIRDALKLPARRETRAQLDGNLAAFLMLRFDETEDERDVTEAIGLYQRSIEAALPAIFLARFESNLGNALRTVRQFSVDRELDCELLDKAIAHHERALKLTPPEGGSRVDYLSNLGTSVAELAQLTGRRDLFERAIGIWEEAWNWIERFLGRSPVAHRFGQHGNLAQLMPRLVTWLLGAPGGNTRDQTLRRRALEFAESAKSMLLAEMLGWSYIAPPLGLDAAIVAREQALVDVLRNLDRQELIDREIWPPSPEAVAHAAGSASEREEALVELEPIWAQIAASGIEGAAFATLRTGARMSFDELKEFGRRRGDDTALVSMLIAPQDTVLMLLRPGPDDPMVIRSPIGESEWATTARRLDREIRTGRGDDRGERWLAPLLELFRDLGQHLDGCRRVVISPHREGQLIPWTVIAQRAEWLTADGTPMPVSSVPSLSLLPRLPEPGGDRRDPVLVVGDPLENLEHARAEAEAVAHVLGCGKPLMGPAATIKDVLAGLRGSRVAHIAAHATFSQEAPLDSRILLADGVLSVRDILGARLDIDLLVLSACETGLSSRIAGDELMGLGHAFIGAGVRSIIVSSWEVSDPATQPFMEVFYRSMGDGTDTATALGHAASHIRSDPRWGHPYFWGAFTLLGAWW